MSVSYLATKFQTQGYSVSHTKSGSKYRYNTVAHVAISHFTLLPELLNLKTKLLPYIMLWWNAARYLRSCQFIMTVFGKFNVERGYQTARFSKNEKLQQNSLVWEQTHKGHLYHKPHSVVGYGESRNKYITILKKSPDSLSSSPTFKWCIKHVPARSRINVDEQNKGWICLFVFKHGEYNRF
jgi:hypothetical protein